MAAIATEADLVSCFIEGMGRGIAKIGQPLGAAILKRAAMVSG